MAMHSLTQSRCGDRSFSISVHDTGIVIGVGDDAALAEIAHAKSVDVRRTAYALLTAADEFDALQHAAARVEEADGDIPAAQ